MRRIVKITNDISIFESLHYGEIIVIENNERYPSFRRGETITDIFDENYHEFFIGNITAYDE